MYYSFKILHFQHISVLTSHISSAPQPHVPEGCHTGQHNSGPADLIWPPSWFVRGSQKHDGQWWCFHSGGASAPTYKSSQSDFRITCPTAHHMFETSGLCKRKYLYTCVSVSVFLYTVCEFQGHLEFQEIQVGYMSSFCLSRSSLLFSTLLWAPNWPMWFPVGSGQ